MARWVAVVVLGGSAAWGILTVVACVLAVVIVVAALCATHKTRKEDKTGNTTSRSSSGSGESMDSPAWKLSNFKLPPKSPGRAIIDTLSGKRLSLGRKWGRSEEEELKAYDRAASEEGNFLWQRSILMGERCQPPDFSGVIIYDDKGNLLPEFPPKTPKHNLFHHPLQADAQRKRSFTGV